jgi:septum formation topological specificity factor MinE
VTKVGDRLRHAWNAFTGADTEPPSFDTGQVAAYGYTRPDRLRLNVTNERSIIASVLTQMSIDIASVGIKHVRVDENEQYLEDISSGLNYCLTTEANIDQPARAFRQDIALSLFDHGVIAIVPVETTLNPDKTSGYDIKNLRVGRIVAWYPKYVRVSVYNEKVGVRQEVTLPKSLVAIVENPLYSVMNEPNSTLQRLIAKLNMLDAVDQQSSSGKLDLIIQLPYTIKSESRRQQAEQRREDIEFQLRGSQYGIAYADATEKITQLNRPAENNLLKQVEYLTQMLYSQLGITEAVMDGTADEKTMLNYKNRTVEPVLGAIIESMNRTFLTKTARAQRQTLMAFSSPFRLVPINDIADIADKFSRNEILTSNEIRQIIGVKPAKDPKADELRNSNMPQVTDPTEDNNSSSSKSTDKEDSDGDKGR